MQLRHFGRGFVLVIISALVLGACGDGEKPAPSGPPLAVEKSRSKEDNRPPVIRSVRLEPSTPIPGETLRAVVDVRDPDGDAVQLGYRWEREGKGMTGQNGVELILSGVRKGDRIGVVVTAGDGLSEAAPIGASVEIANQPPELIGLEVDPGEEVARGERITMVAEGRDPDGDALFYEYAWYVNEEPLSSQEAFLSTENLQRGDEVYAKVLVSDGEAKSAPLRSSVVRIRNAPPAILSTPALEKEEGVFRYQVVAEDPDGDRNLRFRLLKAPEGMHVDPLFGEIRWEPGAEQAGRHTVEVEVRDSNGGATVQTFEVTAAAVEDVKEGTRKEK